MNETLTFADFQDTGNAQAHLVLLAVARCADWETGECWPGVKTIAKMAKCSERTARSYLAKLRDDGFIETEARQRDDGSTSTDLIRLVGYAEWIAASRTGRKGPKPKAVGKYVDIPPANLAGGSQDLPPPPASMLAGPPCKQVAGANEPSLEHKSNSSARTREGDDLDLKGSGRPKFTVTASDPQWQAWIDYLREHEPGAADAALAAGTIHTVGSRWPGNGASYAIKKPAPGLTDRSHAMTGDRG